MAIRFQMSEQMMLARLLAEEVAKCEGMVRWAEENQHSNILNSNKLRIKECISIKDKLVGAMFLSSQSQAIAFDRDYEHYLTAMLANSGRAAQNA